MCFQSLLLPYPANNINRKLLITMRYYINKCNAIAKEKGLKKQLKIVIIRNKIVIKQERPIKC